MTTMKHLLGLTALVGALGTIPAQAQTEVVLHNFRRMFGAAPYAGVIRDPAGNLYGTARFGNGRNSGVVYKVDRAGHYVVLHDFKRADDGAQPFDGVILDAAGNLYGTTLVGGAANWGTVFKIDASGREKVLYRFSGGADGGRPTGGVVLDSSGNLYGTTGIGGTGQGVVFKLDSAGNETVLHTFTGGDDGGQPYAGVILDSSGSLFGTAPQGGAAGFGVVYRISQGGHYEVLHSFGGGQDGANPYGGVIRDPKGVVYGTTLNGGSSGFGVVYKINEILEQRPDEDILYNFTGGADGGNPMGGVVRGPGGNLYGTTLRGGGASNAGVVFEVSPPGRETVLYSFTGLDDGGGSQAGLFRDSKGNLYGTTVTGGKSDGGVLFEIKP